MAKALPTRHYTHPMICDPLSYKWFPNRNNGQRRKQVPSDLRKEKKKCLRPYKKVVTIPMISTDLYYAEDQYDERQEPW